jgi:hypothetical protein
MGISAKEMSKRLHRLANEKTLKILVEAEIAENEEKLIAIKKDEYEQGDIYSRGVRRTYAWKAYREEKLFMNPRADGFVDLIYKGSFIGGFEITTKGKGYTFLSTDSKSNLLKSKYNNSKSDIFDLNQDVFNQFIDKYVKKGFIKALKEQLGQ